jgi:tetratricopeptide (TPR) repeat protein
MKRWIWMTLAAVIVIGAGVTLVAVPTEQEWTTSSPEALAEFDAAMAARFKFYKEDEMRHLERAAELDPEFVLARLWTLGPKFREDEEAAKAEWDQILATDTSKLTPRERLYIERSRLIRAERREEIEPLLDQYLADFPNDPYIIYEMANLYWNRDDFDAAEPLYLRLVEIAPNWVIAYNQLGYINMSEGRFAEAEERFKSYRFIAPDQANPHDSLGELFIATGRIDEAEASFEKAIEIKSNFWPAYNHIALMKSFHDDIGGARAIIDRAKTAGIPDSWVAEMECLVQYKDLRNTGSWEEILELSETSECGENSDMSFPKLWTHLAACEVGDRDKALEIERAVEEWLDELESKGDQVGARFLQFVHFEIEHLRGVRLALQGEYVEAEKLLRSADARVTYIEAPSAIFKLINQTTLAELLLADGQDAEAHGLLARVRSVNALWVTDFQDSGFKMLGLERG